VSDAAHRIEVAWSAASTAKGSDGSLRLWVDGALATELTSLANGSQRIDSAQLGAQGVPSGNKGSELFDAFVSTVSTYIGP
jgi:hypothetical protein